MNELVIIKTDNAGTTKEELINLLEPKTVPNGTTVVYQNINDEGDTYFMVSYKGKNNRENKNKYKNNFITTVIFKYYQTNLPGETDYKKRHHFYGMVA